MPRLSMSWVWPQIHDTASAKKASNEAAICALIVALFTGAIAAASIFLERPVMGLDDSSIPEVLLASLIAIGLAKEQSRIAAVVAVVYWLFAISFKAVNGSANMTTIVILLGFVHGVRGTFAYHKYRGEKPPPSNRLVNNEGERMPSYDELGHPLKALRESAK